MKAKLITFDGTIQLPGYKPGSAAQLRDVEVAFTPLGLAFPVDQDDEILVPWSRVKSARRARQVEPKAE